MGKGDDPLDRGLEIYFGKKGRRPDDSVISAIEKVHGTVSRIMLRDEGSDTVPPVRVPGLTADTLSIEDDRYMVLGEVARGGVGVIYRSRDVDLGREIALKVIRPDLADDSAVVERFIEEAQIGGQLQHPGIVPVYGLGLQSDGRPFFAMKFVKGQTLSALLQERKTPADELRRFTLVFKLACETVAYAHARGVVHRDLKPSNVMVGAFGEVQVVDWGFAKVLGREDTARDRPDRPSIDASVIATIRSEREGSQSVAGSVMGTPAYMPPEQALGQVDDLDERSDVFALGAILTEILTGKPPYVGEGKECLIMAARSHLDEAYERLAESQADEELIELTKSCLSPLKRDRPKDAGELTKRLVAHLSGVEERARREEIEAAEEKARAERERLRLAASRRDAAAAARSRMRSMILAACVLVAVLGAGTALFSVQERRRDRATRANAAVAAALNEATRLRGEEEWERTVAAIDHAAGLAEARGADPEWAKRMEALRHEVSQAKVEADREAERIARDDAFAARLEAIGLQNEHHVGREEVDSQYAAAFRSYGADIDVHRPEEAAAALRECSRSGDVVIGLAGWAYLQRKLLYREGNWPADVLLEVERDETRREMWRAVVDLDLETLLRFAEDPEVFDLPPVALSLLGHALIQAEVGDEHAARFLRDAWARHPDDVRILTFLETASEARLYDTAAMALRPRTAEVRFLRGTMLEKDGREDEALAVWRESFDLDPESASFVAKRIAEILEEREDFDGAIETYRKGIENARDREEESAHLRHLSSLLVKRGRPEEALAEAELALEAGAGLRSQVHANRTVMATALFHLGRYDEARSILEENVDGWVRHRCSMLQMLSTLHLRDEDYDAAIALVDRAIEHRPDAEGLWLLRATYLTAHDPDRGQEAVTEAYRRFPERELVFLRLAELLESRGAPGHEVVGDEDDGAVLRCPDCGRRLGNPSHLEDAIEFCERHLEEYPDFAYAHLILGKYLALKGEEEDGEFHLERGLDLRRYDAYAHEQVSWLRKNQGRNDESVEAAKRAVELAPMRHSAHLRLAQALQGQGNGFRAGQSYERAWELNPTPHMLQHLLRFLVSSGRGYERVQVLRTARSRMPGAPWIVATLGAVLHEEQQPAAAADVLEEAVRADPRSPGLWYRLGLVRQQLSRIEPAIEAFEQVILRAAEIEGTVELVRAARSGRVRLFMDRGETDRALEEVEALLTLDPESFRATALRAELLRRSGRLEAAVVEFEARVAGSPEDASLARQLGLLHLHGTRDRGRAMALLRVAAKLEPENGRGLFLLGSLLAERGEFEPAEAALRGAIEEAFPERGLAWHELGSVLARRSPLKRALAAHEKGAGLDPAHVDPDHIRCLLLAADLEGTISLARRAVSAGGGREPWALLALARALRLKEEYREAEDLEIAARKLDPGSPHALRSEGRAHFREGRFAEAAAAWRSALAAAKGRSVPDPGLLGAVEREIRFAEDAAALLDRWEEISSPGFVPKDAAEAHLCFLLATGEDHTALATRFGERAIALDPSLGPGSHRYHEYARTALSAGSFEGLDSIDTTDEEAARLRGLALSWFRALLEDRRRSVRDGGLPRHVALFDVAVWKMDEALSGLREDSALKRFSDEEVDEWRAFWKSVDEFHRQLMEEE